jgi:hypothetical protein
MAKNEPSMRHCFADNPDVYSFTGDLAEGLKAAARLVKDYDGWVNLTVTPDVEDPTEYDVMVYLH